MKLLNDASGNAEFVRAGQSCNITGQLVDGDGANIALAALATFTGTLYDKTAKTIINSRSAVNFKNANGAVVTSTGAFTIELDASDNVIVGTVTAYVKQRHVLQLNWTWDDGDGTRYGGELLEFDCEAWPTPT